MKYNNYELESLRYNKFPQKMTQNWLLLRIYHKPQINYCKWLNAWIIHYLETVLIYNTSKFSLRLIWIQISQLHKFDRIKRASWKLARSNGPFVSDKSVWLYSNEN